MSCSGDSSRGKGVLASLEHERGRTDRAIELVREILPAVRQGTDRLVSACFFTDLTGYLAATNDFDGATEAGHEAIAALAQEPDHYDVASALEHLALVDAARSRFYRAAILAAYTESAFAKIGVSRRFTLQTTRDRLVALLEVHLKPEERLRFSEEGATLTPEAAVALALSEHFSDSATA